MVVAKLFDTTIPTVVLVGQTNVGKSTLFNALVGHRRSITTDSANTTRDLVDEIVTVNNKTIRIVDTPGINPKKGKLNEQIKQTTTAAIKDAGVVVLVVDRTVPISQFDIELTRLLKRQNKHIVLVLSKSDKLRLAAPLDAFARFGELRIFEVSAINKVGINILYDYFTAKLNSKTVPAQTNNPLKVALIGRPNVGKSTLFNNLIGKGRSLTSEIPHTTRDMVTVELKWQKQTIILADTAGLRRAAKIERGVEFYSASRTQEAIKWADVCLLILDASELGVSFDQSLAGKIIDSGKALVIIVNKVDALAEVGLSRSAVLSTLKQNFAFCWWAPALLISATTGRNTAIIIDSINLVATNMHRNIETAKLNRVLGEAMAAHPPQSTTTTQARLNYITQIDSSPPTFAIFGNQEGSIHFSYRRYLENKLRESFDFSGTPIKLIFKDKRKNESSSRLR